MPEHAFERFRRLHGLVLQKCAMGPVTKEIGPIEGGVLVDDAKLPREIEGRERLELMTPLALLRALHVHGIRMTLYPRGRVQCHAPQDVWTPALLDALNRHQVDVADLVEAFEERAAIAEHCGGLSRVDAEWLAWEALLQKEMA